MYYFVRNEGFHIDRKPPEGVIYPEIALDADHKVKLVDQRPPCASYKFPIIPQYMPSLLKSNLQKAVRRQHSAVAFVTAKQLLTQNPNELLRRLPIIMCEDTLLHPPLFLEIVWLMAAVSKGYVLSAADCQTIMDFVGAMLLAPAMVNHAVGAPEAVLNYNDPLQFAFLLRIGYGGMKSDEAFMGRLVERVAIGELPRNLEFIHIDYESVGTFQIEHHLLREAVDFHCFPSMISATGVRKPSIWFNRSAVNVRTYTGLGATEGISTFVRAATEFALTAKELEAIEDFVDETIVRIRGHVKKKEPTQSRLTHFVRRGAASAAALPQKMKPADT